MNFKTLLISALLFCGIKTSAQQDSSNYFINKGQWLVGGAISYTSLQHQEKPHFRASASGGYFVGKLLALGLNVSYIDHDKSIINESSGSTSRNKYTLFSTDIFTRLYFHVKRFAPYGEFGFGEMWARHDGFEKLKYESEYYKTVLGFNYFVSSSVALNCSMSYFLYPHLHDNGLNYSFTRWGLGVQFFPRRNKILNDSDSPLEKGSWIAGGTINLEDGMPNIGYHTNTVNLSVGYFVGKNLIVGARLGNYNLAGIKSTSSSAFVRYYPINKKLAPFVDLAVGNERWRADLSELPKGSGFIIEPTFGLNYFITNITAVESRIGFHKNTDLDRQVMSCQAGLQFFLSRKK